MGQIAFATSLKLSAARDNKAQLAYSLCIQSLNVATVYRYNKLIRVATANVTDSMDSDSVFARFEMLGLAPWGELMMRAKWLSGERKEDLVAGDYGAKEAHHSPDGDIMVIGHAGPSDLGWTMSFDM